MVSDLPICLKRSHDDRKLEPHWTQCHVKIKFEVLAAYYLQLIILVFLFIAFVGWRCLKRARRERERAYSDEQTGYYSSRPTSNHGDAFDDTTSMGSYNLTKDLLRFNARKASKASIKGSFAVSALAGNEMSASGILQVSADRQNQDRNTKPNSFHHKGQMKKPSRLCGSNDEDN